MKKTSTASFIVAIVLLVASIALFVLAALSINATQVYSRVGNGYSYMRVSYNFSLSGTVNALLMVLLGGFLFLGGILLFILAAVTRPAKASCAVSSCTAKPTGQATQTPQTDAVEASIADASADAPSEGSSPETNT